MKKEKILIAFKYILFFFCDYIIAETQNHLKLQYFFCLLEKVIFFFSFPPPQCFPKPFPSGMSHGRFVSETFMLESSRWFGKNSIRRTGKKNSQESIDRNTGHGHITEMLNMLLNILQSSLGLYNKRLTLSQMTNFSLFHT